MYLASRSNSLPILYTWWMMGTETGVRIYMNSCGEMESSKSGKVT